jgi:hypothetical protein
MIRRLESDQDGAAGTKWRKVRTFQLINGKHDAPSASHQLNVALRSAVSEVLNRPITLSSREHQPDGEPSPEIAVSTGDSLPRPAREKGGAAASELVGVDITQTIDAVYCKEQLEAFEQIPTASELRKRHHQANPKNTLGWGGGRSRKKRYRQMRVEHRCSTQIYNCKVPRSLFLQQFMARPETKEALRALRATRGLTHDHDSEDRIVNSYGNQQAAVVAHNAPVDTVVAACGTQRVHAEWPTDIVRIYGVMKPKSIRFRSIGKSGPCECEFYCYVDECSNSQGDVFCTPENCAVGGRCGNSLDEHPSLGLFKADNRGLGVYTKSGIDCGVIVGEYAGAMVAYEGVQPGQEAKAVLKENSGYTYLLHYKAIGGKYVYIEPAAAGSIARFINHSCDANCEFRELRDRADIRVAVITRRPIAPNEELTARYGNNVWFQCNCGASNCASLKKSQEEHGD